jgi:hypothetical protein
VCSSSVDIGVCRDVGAEVLSFLLLVATF